MVLLAGSFIWFGDPLVLWLREEEEPPLTVTLFFASGFCDPLRDGRQEGDRGFHHSQEQELLQADDPTGRRQGGGESLRQGANILLHPGLHWPLFWGESENHIELLN